MKKYLIILIIIFSIQLFADDQSDPLWQKASEIAKANWKWVPGVQEVINLQKNAKGKLKSEEKIVMSYEQLGNEIAASLISAQRDGKSITEEDESVQEILAEDMSADESSLFYNFSGHDLLVTKTSKTKNINGSTCIGFDYSYTKDDEERGEMKASGTAWLDSISGAPLLNEMQIEPPKKMIKEISFTSSYFFDGTNWYMSQVNTKFRLSTLVFKVNVESERNFDKYWLFEE